MANDVKEAERAVARGRPDEALVYLWNALEPARIAGDAKSLQRIARVAQRIAQGGETGEQREAQRLLESLRPAAARAATVAASVPAPEPAAAAPFPRRAPSVDEAETVPEEIVVTGDWVPEGPEAPGQADEADGAPKRSGLGRFVVPLVFLAIVLVNVLNRLLDR